MKTSPILIAFLLFAPGVVLSAVESGYRVSNAFKVGGPAGVLRLDAEGRRLYVAQGKTVEVLNADTGEKLGDIILSGPVRDLAVVPALQRGYVTTGGDQSLAVVDLATLRVLKSAKLPMGDLAAVEYDPASGNVFAAGRDSGDLAVLDANSGELVGRIALGGQLRQMAATNRGRLYVAVQDRNAIEIIDTTKRISLGRLPVSPTTEPAGLGLDEVERRLYVNCASGRVLIVDSDNGQILANVPGGMGEGVVVMDLAPKRVSRGFAVTPDGMVSIAQNIVVTFGHAGSFATKALGTGVAYDAKTGRLFLSGPAQVLVYAK